MKYTKLQKKWIKLILICLGVFLSMPLLIWSALHLYFNYNKESIKEKVTNILKEEVSGNLILGDVEPNLLKTFPKFSLKLKNIHLQDSLYHVHNVEALYLKNIYIQLDAFALIKSQTKINRIIISNGKINLFKNKEKYSNITAFQNKKKKNQNKNSEINIKFISIENLEFNFDNTLRNKNFHFIINKLKGKGNSFEDNPEYYIQLDAFVHQLGFNLDKGVYLEEQELKSNFKATYFKDENKIELLEQLIQIGNEKITSTLKFYIDKPAKYDFYLHSKNLNFKKGMHLLPYNIHKKFEEIDIENPITFDAFLKGGFAYPDTPNVHINIELENNTLITPYGDLTRANINATLINQTNKNLGKNDDNTSIFFEKLEGSFEDVPFKADTTFIYGLNHPHLSTSIFSNFPVVQLNKLTGKAINFNAGSATFDLKYSGPIIPEDTFSRSLHGFLKVKDAGLTYIPNGLHFPQADIDIAFNDEDLELKNILLKSKKSEIKITGEGKRFLNAYFDDPSRINIETEVYSKEIDLNEFKFIIKPKTKIKSKKNLIEKEKSRKFNEKLLSALDKSTFLAKLNIQKVKYNNFKAHEIRGLASFKENAISFDDFNLKHAGGQIKFDAYMDIKKQDLIPIKLNSKISSVNINTLFHAFNNFNIKDLKSENIKGSLDAEINADLIFSEEISLIENSVNGEVKFQINHEELNNFEPLVNLSNYVFKNRQLDQVTFEKIQNKVKIKEGKIYIPPFTIYTSALQFSLKGIYGLQNGTDLFLDIPLKNPEKNKMRIKKGLKPKDNKGLVLYLRIKEDEQGNLKLTWANKKEREKYESFYSKE